MTNETAEGFPGDYSQGKDYLQIGCLACESMSSSDSCAEWALIPTFRERCDSTPFLVFMGRLLRTEFYSALSYGEDEKVAIDQSNPERVQEIVTELARVREELLYEVGTKVETSWGQKRGTRHDAGLSKFRAGDFVLVERPRKPAKLFGV